ncbi:MAG: serine hydrolase domain-containing protein [Bacteroidia bacterium]
MPFLFKRKTRILFLSAFLLFAILACSNKFKFAKTNHEVRIQRIENKLYPIYNLRGQEKPKSIATMMQENKVTGLSIAFVDKGEVVWTKCYGYADVEDSVKVTPETIFRAASLSKPLTAMAALHLVEQGELELDQNINEYLKGWKLPENQFTAVRPVTISNLIGHTSGIRNGVHEPTPANQQIALIEDILSGKVLNTPAEVISVPGEKRRYSNMGYVLLSELLQDVTSKKFSALMENIILNPCGMTSSTFDQSLPKELRERLAVGYDENQRPLPFYLHSSYGAGALYSTPTDLGKFLATILDAYHTKSKDHKVISHEMAKRIFEENETKLGFNKAFENGNVVFRNDGSVPGYNCTFMGSVTKNQAVVIMLNTGSEAAYDFLNYLWRAVAMEYDWGLYEPEFYDKYEMSLPGLETFSGLYANPEDSVLFEIRQNTLQVSCEALIAVGEHSFIRPSRPMKYTFEKDSKGKVIQLYVRDERGDVYPVYRKVE